MFSIPESNHTPSVSGKVLALAITSICALGAGCSVSPKSQNSVCDVVVKTPSPVSVQPSADEAIEIRNWSRTAALYHSGTTQAWPTCWYYQPNPDNMDVTNFIAEPIMMVIQTLSLPVTMIPDYPTRRVCYAGDVAPLSYNAMPPLPPDELRTEGLPDPDPLVAPQPPFLPPLPVVPEPHPGLVVIPEPAPATLPATTRRVVRRPVDPTTQRAK